MFALGDLCIFSFFKEVVQVQYMHIKTMSQRQKEEGDEGDGVKFIPNLQGIRPRGPVGE